jgi:hypothetical protein
MPPIIIRLQVLLARSICQATLLGKRFHRYKNLMTSLSLFSIARAKRRKTNLLEATRRLLLRSIRLFGPKLCSNNDLFRTKVEKNRRDPMASYLLDRAPQPIQDLVLLSLPATSDPAAPSTPRPSPKSKSHAHTARGSCHNRLVYIEGQVSGEAILYSLDGRLICIVPRIHDVEKVSN